MKPITVVIPYSQDNSFYKTLFEFLKSEMTEEIFIISQERVDVPVSGCRVLTGASILSKEVIDNVLKNVKTDYLLILPKYKHVVLEFDALGKLVETAISTKAGIIYPDFYDEKQEGRYIHPLNNYQPGSVRDDFDFGSMMLFSVFAVMDVLDKYGPISDVKYAGLYDLRLKVSIGHSIYHKNSPIYSVFMKEEMQCGHENIFAYVDPENIFVQKEMETVFTDYLKKINAYLPPHNLKGAMESPEIFPVEASVVIPVKNRRATIGDALESALLQETGFKFNVIVVDNHSTDGTTAVLENFAKKHSSLKYISPSKTDLGIGGCWNEAIYSKICGKYAVQLDSDDLYSSPHTLAKIVHMLREYNYAMVVGSYTIVNFDLETIPPGLIEHREWTEENGYNNALRINGLGAPRAFNTSVIRKIGFLNVSYGEDYAAALRICREYRIGRIFENLYLCRRWSGNTDAVLEIDDRNCNDAFKDMIRTEEITARQKMNRENTR